MDYRSNEVWEMYKTLVLDSTKEKSKKTESGRWKNHIAPLIGNKKIKDLNQIDYLKIRRSVEQKGLSPQTVHHCLSLLRRVLVRAYKWELIDKEPQTFKEIMPKFDNKRIRFLSKDEAKILLKIIRQKDISDRWHDIVLFALNTGLRKGEIFSLTKNDINMQYKYVNVLNTKSKKNRTVPLNDITANLIKKRIASSRKIHFLFEDDNDYVFSDAVKEAGLNEGITDLRQKVVFHTLRHTFASWLVQDGFPLTLVSELLGHSSIDMTMRYAHLSPNYGVQAVEQIGNRFRK